MTSKTQAPKSEAQSHKPTFGESAEKPQRTEPHGDPTTLADEKAKEGEENKATSGKKPDEHQASPGTINNLEVLADQQHQSEQNDPDQFQRAIHQPTTQDVLADPINRPKTIDPMTGHVHYVADAKALPGGTAAHEGDV